MDIRAAIENTLYRWAFMYDTDDVGGIGECLTEDAEVEFSTGVQKGRSAVEAELARQRGKWRAEGATPRHLITNVWIRRETPHEADVTSSFAFFVKSNGTPPALVAVGSYDDVLVEDGGVWKVKMRRGVTM